MLCPSSTPTGRFSAGCRLQFPRAVSPFHTSAVDGPVLHSSSRPVLALCLSLSQRNLADCFFHSWYTAALHRLHIFVIAPRHQNLDPGQPYSPMENHLAPVVFLSLPGPFAYWLGGRTRSRACSSAPHRLVDLFCLTRKRMSSSAMASMN